MDNFEWSPHFSVGVKILDEQHKELIKMINMLDRNPGATVYSETVSELLGRLTSYAMEHFETEEALLSEHSYPDLAIQKLEHNEYQLKAAMLCEKTIQQEEAVSKEILIFLRTWWMNHILVSDMKYRVFFEELGLK